MGQKQRRPRRGRKSFAKGFRVKGITAAALDRYITDLETRNGQKATARDLLDSARPKSSAIHHLFEWNDRAAAEEHRLERARYLLRAVIVEFHIEKSRTPITVRSHVFSKRDKAYVSIRTALTDEDRRAELVEQALSELRAWQRNYQALNELASIFQAIDDLKI